MLCKKCGSEVPDGVSFCTNCGNKLKNGSGTYAVVPVVENKEKDNNKDRKDSDSKGRSETDKDKKTEKKDLRILTDKEEQAFLLGIEDEDDPDKKEESDERKTSKGEKDKKKIIGNLKLKPSVLLVLTGAFIVIAICLVFLFSASARNGIKKTFMSNLSYFKSTIRDTAGYLTDCIGTAYEDDILGFLDIVNSEYTIKADLRKRNEADRLLERLREKNRFLDLEWLEKGAVSASFSMKENKAKLEGKITLNKADVLDFNIMSDIDSKEAYLNIPIVTDKYLTVKIPDSFAYIDYLKSFSDFKEALPKGKEAKKLVLKYLDIILDRIEEVEVTKEEPTEAVYVKNNYYMMKAMLSVEKQKEIAYAVLDELEKDTEVLSILAGLQKTGKLKEEVSVDSFLERIKYLREHMDELVKKDYRLLIWVDENGNVIAQELLDDDRCGYSYKFVINDGNFGFELGKIDASRTIVSGVKASGRITKEKLSGMFNVIKDYSEVYMITFQDVDENKLLKGNPQGKITYCIQDPFLDSEFRDLKLIFDFDLMMKKSTVNITVTESEKILCEAQITLKRSSASSIKLPEDADRKKHLADWSDTIKLDKIMKKAKDADMTGSIYYDYLEKMKDKGVSNVIDSVQNN